MYNKAKEKTEMEVSIKTTGNLSIPDAIQNAAGLKKQVEASGQKVRVMSGDKARKIAARLSRMRAAKHAAEGFDPGARDE